MIDTVNGYRGGLYGFFSGHAANSFGLATLFMWLVRDTWFNVSVGIWAALNSYIRVYLGVHFLGDIVVGAIFGIIVGTLLYLIYTFLIRKRKVPFRDSVLYTKTGFLRKDIHSFLSVLSGTYIVILISSCMIW
jgi:undecaprenyl-diphosphatase